MILPFAMPRAGALVRNKEVQPIELVEAAIARIERLNPTLNAVVTPMYDLARTFAGGKIPAGPFTGVPFLLKDIIASYAGVKMSMGMKLRRDFVPDHDSELVARLKRAGLIVVGKTNLPELGILPTTEPLLFGPCRNPWDTERTTGGSSGGSASGRRGRNGAHGPCQRRWRLHSHSSRMLRPLRSQTDPGPQPPGSGFWRRARRPGSRTRGHPIGQGQRSTARRHRRSDVGDPYWAPLPRDRLFRRSAPIPEGFVSPLPSARTPASRFMPIV